MCSSLAHTRTTLHRHTHAHATHIKPQLVITLTFSTKDHAKKKKKTFFAFLPIFFFFFYQYTHTCLPIQSLGFISARRRSHESSRDLLMHMARELSTYSTCVDASCMAWRSFFLFFLILTYSYHYYIAHIAYHKQYVQKLIVVFIYLFLLFRIREFSFQVFVQSQLCILERSAIACAEKRNLNITRALL